MIFNEDVLFIHNGKTGGISCANYLLQVLRGPIYVCRADAETYCAARPGGELIPVSGINLHCPLSVAEPYLLRSSGIYLSELKKILVVIRHPLTLEYSFYLHLQKPHVRERRKSNPDLLRLADGSFSDFVRHSGYHREGMPQEAFFLLDGQRPKNIELIRFECLEAEFTRALTPFVKVDACTKFPHLNASQPKVLLQDLVNSEVCELIYDKHRFMFDSGLYDIKVL